MKLLGLNSPEIFIILVVLLSILGPKRIEKGFLLFKKLLKYLLSQDDNLALGNTELKEKLKLINEKPDESEVKDEIIDAEIKSEKPDESEVKDEIIDAEIKSEEPDESEVKDEIIDAEIKSEELKKSEVKNEILDLETNLDEK